MANLDPAVADVLDRADHDSTSDEDGLIDALERDDDMAGLRERRLQQLHAEVVRAKEMRNSHHGTYHELKDEKAIMEITTQTKLVVVHFFRSDFNRCRIMDAHLETLAPKHTDTRFLRINVDNAPFLVTKLKVQVLPSVFAFVDGVSKDRLLGFEGIGRGTDSFKTWQLEARLLQSGVLTRAKMQGDTAIAKTRTVSETRQEMSDGDDDWD